MTRDTDPHHALAAGTGAHPCGRLRALIEPPASNFAAPAPEPVPMVSATVLVPNNVAVLREEFDDGPGLKHIAI